jgi:hypothetical protein
MQSHPDARQIIVQECHRPELTVASGLPRAAGVEDVDARSSSSNDDQVAHAG